ncbi:hypothetical protein [Pseudoalteromonas sp. JC3]|uniref:hypothetical protein n=1 Tax=Pseudoalteromonas sp. JC3 TaxID=2810196 RepID=UPI0019D14DDD|nr:hypothetical protein [Pseudoalteromonas sp. JC3]MBR8842162.1 hypothetical protein [Pseudoalteromonas sp. JC3]WJE09828.1 hypothetical protein QSH61_05045 [Pseudoalteromonas sp. JC3]
MKYLALIATISISNLAAAQGEVAAEWQLGQYAVSIGEKCIITVSTPASKEIIANGFNNDKACKVAYLAQTNIPNAYVIGGAHILIVEQQTIQSKSCWRVSKALYLPTDGQAALSTTQIESGNCDGHIEPNGAMYLISALQNPI